MSWWKRWRKQRACFHHDRATGETWIRGQIVDCGRAKLFWCLNCDRLWI